MSDAIRTRDCVIADLTAECKSLRAELAAERAKVAELERDKQLLIESNDHVSIELANAHEKIAELAAEISKKE